MTHRLPTLVTDRLTLRPFELCDAPCVQTLAGHPEVYRTTTNVPHPYLDGMAEQWISGHHDAFRQGIDATFAICRKSDGALVGAIELGGITPGHQAELGYWIGKPYWRNGYCTEASRAVFDFGFTTLGLARIHSCYLSRNPASGRVMQKLGMSHEGCRRAHVRKWDKLEDLELYGILVGDWNAKK
jgi:RimJ/RimL family protein N-acetyltransferase